MCWRGRGGRKLHVDGGYDSLDHDGNGGSIRREGWILYREREARIVGVGWRQTNLVCKSNGEECVCPREDDDEEPSRGGCRVLLVNRNQDRAATLSIFLNNHRWDGRCIRVSEKRWYEKMEKLLGGVDVWRKVASWTEVNRVDFG